MDKTIVTRSSKGFMNVSLVSTWTIDKVTQKKIDEIGIDNIDKIIIEVGEEKYCIVTEDKINKL